MVSFLRIDPGERCVEPDPDGIWVRAWIRVGMAVTGDMPPGVEERYERAVAELPSLTRRFFLAHHADGLDYPDLASRFDISMAEVETRMTDALAAVARAYAMTPIRPIMQTASER